MTYTKETLQEEITSMLNNIELYCKAIIKEVNQKRSGGYFSLVYIHEKCNTIESLAKGIKHDEELMWLNKITLTLPMQDSGSVCW